MFASFGLQLRLAAKPTPRTLVLKGDIHGTSRADPDSGPHRRSWALRGPIQSIPRAWNWAPVLSRRPPAHRGFRHRFGTLDPRALACPDADLRSVVGQPARAQALW